MITYNEFLQAVSILSSIAIVLYIAYEQGHKKYSFWYIFMRWLRFGDTEPYKWLMTKKYYIALWFLCVGQLITISGLLREFGMGRINGKPMEFFFSAPMTKICIVYLIHELIKSKSPSYKKKVDMVARTLGEFVTKLR